jgi:hypothetical protein
MPDATNTQIIKVVYEASEAERAARKRSADEQKRVRDDATKAKQADKEVSDNKKKLDRESADALNKAIKDGTDSTKRAARERSDAEKRAVADVADARRKAARDQRDRDAEAGKALKDFGAGLKANQRKWEEQQAAIGGAAKQVIGFTAAMVGLNSAGAVMATIAERFTKLRESAVEGAKNMLAQAASMRSLSAVTGQTGQPSATHLDVLRQAMQTFQTPEDFAQMYQAAMGKGFGAVQAGLVSEQEMKKAAVFQGRRQLMYGESPEAMGSILGMLPMMSEKKGQTGEELEALNQRLDEIRKLAGYQSYAQAVGQVERVSPYVLKGIYSGPMAMALTGAMALGSKPEEAGTHLEQATTAVTVGMMRARHMKVLPEDAQQYLTTAEYFKKLTDRQGKKITDQTPAEERILAVVDDVLRAEDAAVKAGQHFEGTLYLTKQGFLNQEHMLALTSLVGVQRKGLLQQMLDAGRAPIAPHVAGTGVDADFARFQRDPVGAEMIAEREVELAEQAAFAKDRFSRVRMQAAFSRLGGKGRFGEGVDEIMKRSDWNLYEQMFGPRHQLELEAQKEIVKQAQAAGVALPQNFGFRGVRGRMTPSFEGWEKLFDVAQQTGAAGGRVLPGPNDAQNTANLQRIADNTERLLGRAPGAGGPPPGQPPAPMPSKPPPFVGRAESNIGQGSW